MTLPIHVPQQVGVQTRYTKNKFGKSLGQVLFLAIRIKSSSCLFRPLGCRPSSKDIKKKNKTLDSKCLRFQCFQLIVIKRFVKPSFNSGLWL